MGSSNRKLFSYLSIKIGKTYHENPCCEQRKVWAFQDVPHALKLLRNHLLDYGFTLSNGECVTKNLFEDLIKMNYNKSDLHYCYNVSDSHVILSGSEK